MTVLVPDHLDDALSALADDPGLTVLAGGTDLMVDVNYGRRRPGGRAVAAAGGRAAPAALADPGRGRNG